MIWTVMCMKSSTKEQTDVEFKVGYNILTDDDEIKWIVFGNEKGGFDDRSAFPEDKFMWLKNAYYIESVTICYYKLFLLFKGLINV